MFVSGGLGDPKVSPDFMSGIADGLLFNITVLGINRLTWEGTVQDSLCPNVNLGSNHQDSLGRQVHSGVLSRDVMGLVTFGWLDANEFSIPEKLRKEIGVKSYR